MKFSERTYLHFLEDIVFAIQRIREYTSGMEYENFRFDNKTVDAVIRNFEIIGEAAKRLPSELKKHHPEVPWEEMYRLRNKVTHEYFGIDYETIWDIVCNYLPSDEQALAKILKSEIESGNPRGLFHKDG